MSITGELALLEKLKLQDENAFSQLYSLYVKKIYAFALGILKSPSLAEDVTQETFIKLWEYAAFVDTDRSVQALLFTMARNQALNVLKRASRESKVTDEIFSYADESTENGLEYTQRRQTSEFIFNAVQQLPPQRQLIYQLCRNHGYTYKKVAQKLGIKDSTVNSQMVKAIKAIKDYMFRNGAMTLIFISSLSSPPW